MGEKNKVETRRTYSGAMVMAAEGESIEEEIRKEEGLI
jgi:hypothetical protein